MPKFNVDLALDSKKKVTNVESTDKPVPPEILQVDSGLSQVLGDDLDTLRELTQPEKELDALQDLSELSSGTLQV